MVATVTRDAGIFQAEPTGDFIDWTDGDWETLRETLAEPLRRMIARVTRMDTDSSAVTELVFAAECWLRKYLTARLRSADLRTAMRQSSSPRVFLQCLCLSAVLRLFLWQPERIRSGQNSWWLVDDSTWRIQQLNESPASLEPVLASALENLGLQIETFLRPRDPKGGDWLMLRMSADGRLWSMVADTQGKSWRAWLLKRCVYLLWEISWRREHASPAALLSDLDQALCRADCLPEGFFIEATVGMFAREGLSVLSSAGVGYVLQRREQLRRVEFRRLSGPLLGLGMNADIVEEHIRLAPGDAVACMSDGVADQPTRHGRLGLSLANSLASDSRPLHAGLLQIFQSAVDTQGQFDDVTIVTVSRRAT